VLGLETGANCDKNLVGDIANLRKETSDSRAGS